MTSFVTQEYGKVKTGVPNDVIVPTCLILALEPTAGEFWVVSFDLFFILFYYSYEMHLPNFDWLRSAVVELCYFWL